MKAIAVSLLALLPVLPAKASSFKTPVWTDGSASGFEVTVDGEQAAVKSFQSPGAGLILLVVLDTVRRPDRFAAAREGLMAKLQALGPNYFAGALTAQDGLSVLQHPIRGREKLRRTLESVDVRGMAGLLDVIVETSRIADKTLAAADVRVAALFLTDGGIEDYRDEYTIPVVNPSDQRDLSRRFRDQLILERIRSISDALEPAQAPLFFLHLARRHDDLNEVYQNGISNFARITGGQALFAQALQEIPAMVEQLLDRIASHWVLRVEAECGGTVRLSVRSAGMPTRHRESINCVQAAQ